MSVKPFIPILALLLLAPVSVRELGVPRVEGQQAGTQAKKAASAPVARQISDKLAQKGGQAYADLAVHESNGIVTLVGMVPTLRDHDVAIQIAEGFGGVRSIVDRMQIARSAESDGAIRDRILAALKADAVTRNALSQVSVRNGIATIEGKAPSWASREMISWVAKGVPGVLGVQNEVALDTRAPRTDQEIADEIRGRIDRDPWLSASNVNVAVKDGNVEITGTVPTLADEDRIRLHSSVIGRKSVDLSKVKVAQQAGSAGSRGAPVKTDGQLGLAVKDALSLDPRMGDSERGIKVNVRNGVATLKGTVEDFRAYDAAESDARNTIGIFAVVNQLTVRPAAQRPDRDLAADTQNALASAPDLKGSDITFQVRNGTVIMNDSRATPEQRRLARQLAGSVPGIVGVRETASKIPGQNASSDDVLKGAIEKAISINPLIGANDQITLHVSGGLVRMTGSVGSMAAKVSLSRDALSAGATRVNNVVRVRVEDGRQARLLPNEPGRPNIWEYPIRPAG